MCSIEYSGEAVTPKFEKHYNREIERIFFPRCLSLSSVAALRGPLNLVPVPHACNPSYSRGQRLGGLRFETSPGQ
jgi:hypothetical protein